MPPAPGRLSFFGGIEPKTPFPRIIENNSKKMETSETSDPSVSFNTP
jgi:hypothetical protein